MIEQQEKVAPRFAGSKQEQELAGRVFAIMTARGMFMSTDAPIKLSLSSLADYFESQGEKNGRPRLEAAIGANSELFSFEETGEDLLVVTTRAGRAPSQLVPLSRHTFASRFHTPLPKPEAQAARPRPRPQAPMVDVLAGLEAEAAVPVEPEALVLTVEPEPAEEVPAARTITTQIIRATDVADVDDVRLALAIKDRFGTDPRVASFGEQWLMEDRVPRFSRGDLRRLREYMQEKEQPLTDDDLAQDVFGVRPASPEFELLRFGINYRLSSEHREFEFVGTANQRFWSTSGLPQIGTTRRKLNEIGTDYRYLLDEAPAEPAYRSLGSIDHTLTFYEYIHGLLPYDVELQSLLPGPVTPAQKSAVLTFECPQSFTTYLVELRFPTPNRGGFILGLDDFFTENLVPGAFVSVQRTDNDGHYRVEYLAESPRSEQLLELDERRAQRYVFRPTTFACGVADQRLLTEDRFGGMANEKPLDEKVRRRPEAVVSATFERIGEARDGNFSADLETLLAGVNIERPMSETLLRSILENDDSGAFSRDPDADDSYTYVPGTTP